MNSPTRAAFFRIAAAALLIGSAAFTSSAQQARRSAGDGGLPPRDEWQRVPDILAAAGAAEGRRIADIAAGQGSHQTALAKGWQVGPCVRCRDQRGRAALTGGAGFFKLRAEQASHHAIDPAFVDAELRAAGFEIARRQDDFIVQPFAQWLIVARRPRK